MIDRNHFCCHKRRRFQREVTYICAMDITAAELSARRWKISWLHFLPRFLLSLLFEVAIDVNNARCNVTGI